MNRKLVISVPIVAGVLALSTGVGVAFAKGADQSSAATANYAALPANSSANSNAVGYCGGFGGMMGLNRMVLTPQVAALLGTTVADLEAQLSSGKTLAELAAAKGVSQDVLKQTMLAPAKDMMALMLKYGYLTQEQIDSMTQRMQTVVQSMMTAQIRDLDNDMWDIMRDMMGSNGYGMMGGWNNQSQQSGSSAAGQQPAPSTAPRGGFGGMMGGGGMMGWR